MPALMIGGATALSAGGSIFSGIMGKSAAKKQAEAIKQAREKAIGSVQKGVDSASGELRSFRERGDTAGTTLADLLSGKLDPDAVLKASSLFKFQQEQGSRDINRQLKMRGLYGSGAGLEYQQRFENQLVGEEGQRQYDRLFQLSEQGMRAGAQIGQWDVNGGNAIGNIEMQAGLGVGQAQAAGINSMAQGISGAVQSVANGGMNYMNYKMLEPILAKLGGAGGGGGMTEEAMLGYQQEALGRGIVGGAQNQRYQDLVDNAGMMEGVSWASNPY